MHHIKHQQRSKFFEVGLHVNEVWHQRTIQREVLVSTPYSLLIIWCLHFFTQSHSCETRTAA